MENVLDKLKGGDLRSIGRADEVAADAIEKVARVRPEYVRPYKRKLIYEALGIPQQEMRWHVVLLLPHLALNKEEKEAVINTLFAFIDNEKSRIVKVNAMQALAEMAAQDASIAVLMLSKLQQVMNRGSPAMISRAKKLIKDLERIK